MQASDIAALTPSAVIARFAEICRIPHGSGHEQALADYLMRFATSRGLKAVKDAPGNVIIHKPASPGVGSPHPVIVQAHMDMVWTKEPGKQFDFATQPIPLELDGEWLRSAGTTLGADNGIGMAYALALLDEPGGLPAIEAVFTVSEETGMDGALGFDASLLDGTMLINLDTDEEGIFYASCSGGQDAEIMLPLVMVPPPAEKSLWRRVGVTGLKGGHSGVEIDKGRGNALRLLGRVVDDLVRECGAAIAEVHGGIVRNAIPTDSWADIALPEAMQAAAAACIAKWQSVFSDELRGAGETPVLALAPAEARPTVFAPNMAGTVVFLMNIIPHGVEAMDLNLAALRLVETSTNFAMMRQNDTGVSFTIGIRSSLDGKRAMMARRLALLAAAVGAEFSTGNGYSGWAYDPHSGLRDIFQKAYSILYKGKTGVVEGTHAGLECGVFSRKFAEAGKPLDIVSFGPDIRGAHTPEERANVPSIGRVWEMLLTGLRLIAEPK